MKLDGREFSDVDHDITAAQNDYIIGHLRAAGALEALAGLNLKEDLSLDQVEKPAKDFVTRIYLTGRKSFILAGLLTEVGKKWTRAEADRNAAKFDAITDLEEITAMGAIIANVVLVFFQFAGKSSRSFRTFSNPTDADHGTKTADPATSGSSIQ